MRPSPRAECDAGLARGDRPRRNVRDFVTRDLFSKILEAEEDHVDFIETQLDLISKVGTENYIQLQSGHAE